MTVYADKKTRSHEKLALVIPTFNERGNIFTLLTRVLAVLDGVELASEVLVVDDESCDGTAELVAAIARTDPRVRLIVRRGERGLAGAILHGWESTDANFLGVMDADLQHPPELLPALVQAILDGSDLAIGSRYARGGRRSGWNPARRLFSTAATWATWPLQRGGLRAKDPLSGFFLVQRRCLSHMPFQRTGFKLLLEILVRARVRSIQEIPIVFARRHAGRSKANFAVVKDYLTLLARLYRARLDISRPLHNAEAD